MIKKLSAVALAISLVTGSIQVSAAGGSVPQSTPFANQAYKAWYPPGFAPIPGHESFAYKNRAGGKCVSSARACISLAVVANKSCKRALYMEFAFFDKNDYRVDYSNFYAAKVKKGQKFKMALPSFKRAARWEMIELQCI